MFRLFNKREAYNLQNCKIRKYIFPIKSSFLNCIRCKSYYQVLGLNSDASSKDIKTAYYELSLKFHPDKNKGSPESVEKFREITEAYEVLGNPQKRLSYDQGKDSSSSYSSSNNYTGREGHYYRPYQSRQRNQGPFTGKTRDFNYDEHFRQHYEKERMYEYEYIKRRWEAEFRRRHPDRDPNEEYYRNQYKQSGRSRSHEDFQKARREFYEEYKRLLAKKIRVLYFFIPFWFIFLMIPIMIDMSDPDKKSRPRSHHGPIYYKVKDEKHNGQDGE